MSRFVAKFSVLCLLTIFLYAIPLMAQNSGSIGGTVVDPQGAVIAGASVQAIDAGKGTVIREMTTGPDGLFVLQPLQPGDYNVRVKAKGMKDLERKGIHLDSRQVVGLGELAMAVGGATEILTVEATTPLVETATADHSAVIDSRLVTETSLNGRDFQSLVRTLPGVISNDTSDFRLAFNNTDAFHVNGMRGSANNFYLDGAINTDVGANDGQFTQLSMDALGEFKLQTSNFAAEYGRNPGILMAVNTKSGTQKLHGTLYEFNREDGFDSKAAFATTKSELRFHQFGGNIGGPIPLPGAKNKLFFFYNYEGTRAFRPTAGQFQSTTLPGLGFGFALPDPKWLTGDFTSAYKSGTIGHTTYQTGQIFMPGTITYDPTDGQINGGTPICGTPSSPCNIVPTTMFSSQAPAIIKFLQGSAYAKGNYVPYPGDPSRVFVPFQDTYHFRKNQHVIRIDFNANAKTNFFFRWVDDSQREADQAGLFSWGDYPILPEFRKKPGSSWSWNLVNVISPTLTNEFIFSYNHLTQVVDVDSTVPKSYYDRDALGFTFQEFYPLANVRNRFPTLGGGNGTFTGNVFPPGWHSEARMFTWTDNVSKVHGAHTFKTGVFFDYNQAGQQPSWTDATSFNFGTGSSNLMDSGSYVANMLLGNFLTANQSNGIFFGAFRFHQFEAFGQDSWKVNRKLTVDYGLRWAYLGPTYTVQPFFQNYFDTKRYNPANAVTIDTVGCNDPPACTSRNSLLAGQIIPGSGDLFNGIVQEGKGIPPGFAKHHYGNFGPRLGFAYDLRGDGKTAIRGGAGIFYERIRQNINSFDALGNPPLVYTPTVYNNNMGNVNYGPGLVTGTRFPVGVNAFDGEGQIPTTYSWSIGVQQELPWKLGAEVVYVGNTARHLQYQYNLQTFPLGAELTPPPFQGGDPYPYHGYSFINYTKYAANSSYNALQAKVTRRFHRDLTLTADYTYSRNRDLIDQDNTNLGAGNIPISDPFNPGNYYGLSGWDRTHVFNFNYVYSLPELRNKGALRYVLGGWEVSGITRFWSGPPIDITVPNGNPGNLVGGGVRPDFAGGSVYVSGHHGLQGASSDKMWFNPFLFSTPLAGSVGNLKRNEFRGPGINNWDMSLFKNFNFTESVRLQLRLESFNTFNHIQPAGVNTSINTPGLGQAPTPNTGTSTGTVGSAGQINGYRDMRNVQLGVKLYF